MIQTPAYLVPKAMTESERLALLAYLAQDDDRTDARPDVRSKHPLWEQPGWPRHIIQGIMDRLLAKPYHIQEITFRQDSIGLKLHTDYGSPESAQGKTLMLLLDATPEAQTIFFTNYLTTWERWGAFFTKTKWNRYQYPLVDKSGKIKVVEDLRQLLQACQSAPESVQDFDITDEFLQEVKRLIHKRSLPKLEPADQDPESGYMQPGLRLDRYDLLSDYRPGSLFDQQIHERYLSQTPITDLHGLTVQSVIDWQVGGALIFDREQLHSSSDRHRQKSFITIFYHIVE